MGSQNSAVIQQSSPGTMIIGVPGNVNLGSISFDSNGPYELQFKVTGSQPTVVSVGTIRSRRRWQ